MRDPLEGVSESGIIRTGSHGARVGEAFRPVHDAAIAMIHECDASASVYAYGSVVTGQARVRTSDVDLLTIGLEPGAAARIAAELSARFVETCRDVEIAGGAPEDFVGDSDESYGNRVFLRHYCVLLAGSDVHRPQHDFVADRRAARGFNGDIARHADRWRHALDADSEPVERVARRMARKSLLAVAGLVSVLDQTWTTDRRTGAQRWGEIVPERCDVLTQMLSWTSGRLEHSDAEVREMLDHTVAAIVEAFSEVIGLWPDQEKP